MNINRLLSLAVAAFYLLEAFFYEERSYQLGIMIFSAVLLPFLWYGDILGHFVTNSAARGPVIDTATPGCLVAFVAWVIFLLPAVALLYFRIAKVV